MEQLQRELEDLDEDQRKMIKTLIVHNQALEHTVLINLANNQVRKFKAENESKRLLMQQSTSNDPNQLIVPKNYRTVPCRNYHGPNGCQRGNFCHFIHGQGFERVEMPRDVYMNLRNQNVRMNYLQEI